MNFPTNHAHTTSLPHTQPPPPHTIPPSDLIVVSTHRVWTKIGAAPNPTSECPHLGTHPWSLRICSRSALPPALPSPSLSHSPSLTPSHCLARALSHSLNVSPTRYHSSEQGLPPFIPLKSSRVSHAVCRASTSRRPLPPPTNIIRTPSTLRSGSRGRCPSS